MEGNTCGISYYLCDNISITCKNLRKRLRNKKLAPTHPRRCPIN